MCDILQHYGSFISGLLGFSGIILTLIIQRAARTVNMHVKMRSLKESC